MIDIMDFVKQREDLAPVREILDGYPREQRFLLAILQDIQKTYGYLPREALETVRLHLDVPLSRLYSMATFYKALSLKPKGEYVIKVCDGTACHIKNSQGLLDELKRLLGIEPGETTVDGRFSLETVNCLGSCALAPVMVINDVYYAKVEPDKIREILGMLGGKGYGDI